ncbi:MAG: hypothetical protein ABI318_07315 [Chthoniobacteraceae bacterium]
MKTTSLISSALCLYLVLFAALALRGSAADPIAAPAPVITEGSGDVRPGKLIALRGEGLKDWYEAAPIKDLEVYIGGVPIPGAEVLLSKLRDNWISVYLSRDGTKKESRDAWNRVLSQSLEFLGGEPPRVDVTLGKKGELPLISNASARLRMTIVAKGMLWAWIGAMLLLAVLLFWLGKASDLLRDDGPAPAGARKAFSLARTQMAFWLFVTVGAYLFILMVTGDPNTITGSVLALIGISAATGLGAVAMDSAKASAIKTKLDDARKRIDALNVKRTGGGALTPEEQADLNQKTDDAARLKPQLDPTPSRGFWLDIVSDGGGVSFHRLQIAVWTLVVGVVFIQSVYNSLAMPELSETMLGLMGISGGTYLGFKLPEKSG